MNPSSLLVVLSESQDNKCDFFSCPWVAIVVWDCTCSEAHWKRRRGGGNEDIGNEEELGSKRIFSTTIKTHGDLTKSFNFTGDVLLQNLKSSVKLWNYNAKTCFGGESVTCSLLLTLTRCLRLELGFPCDHKPAAAEGASHRQATELVWSEDLSASGFRFLSFPFPHPGYLVTGLWLNSFLSFLPHHPGSLWDKAPLLKVLPSSCL